MGNPRRRSILRKDSEKLTRVGLLRIEYITSLSLIKLTTGKFQTIKNKMINIPIKTLNLGINEYKEFHQLAVISNPLLKNSLKPGISRIIPKIRNKNFTCVE